MINRLLHIQTNEKAELMVERDSIKHRLSAAEIELEEKRGVTLDKDEWRSVCLEMFDIFQFAVFFVVIDVQYVKYTLNTQNMRAHALFSII